MDLLTMIDSARAVIDKLSLIFTVITVAVALLQCYAGYRMLRFWISLAGGLIGFAAGFGISYVNLKNTPVFIPVLIGVAAAALLGFLAFRLYLAGVFVFCGLIAGSAATLIPFPRQSTWQIVEAVVVVLVFLFAGILSVKFNRQVVILITAISGGIRAAHSLAKLVPILRDHTSYGPFLCALLVITGIMIQFLTTRNYAKKR